MTPAATAPDDDAAMLAELAARDMAAAVRVHDKLMAAEEVSEIVGLANAYRGLSRTVRQTVILKRKAQAEQAQVARKAAFEARWQAQARRDAEDPLQNHCDKALRIVRTVLVRERLDVEDPETLEEEAYDLISEWGREDGFLEAPPIAIARMACDRLGLPLPERADAEPPAFKDEPPAPAPSATAPGERAPPPDRRRRSSG